MSDRPAPPDLDEAALARGIRDGDPQVFEQIVRNYGGRLLSVTRRILRDEDAARDAVQDAFISAFRSRRQFKADSRVSTWLHRIAVNAALMKLRSQRRKPETPIEGFLPSFTEDGHHTDRFVAWTERGIDLAGDDEDARSWLGPLYNNIGWEYYEAGEFEEALTAFRLGLGIREEASQEAQPVEIARYAVGKALRALGRSDEAVPLLERAVAWAEAAGAPDGWFHEELALEYAALRRDADGAVHARAAIPLLERDDPDFVADGERAAQLRTIAALE